MNMIAFGVLSLSSPAQHLRINSLPGLLFEGIKFSNAEVRFNARRGRRRLRDGQRGRRRRRRRRNSRRAVGDAVGFLVAPVAAAPVAAAARGRARQVKWTVSQLLLLHERGRHRARTPRLRCCALSDALKRLMSDGGDGQRQAAAALQRRRRAAPR